MIVNVAVVHPEGISLSGMSGRIFLPQPSQVHSQISTFFFITDDLPA